MALAESGLFTSAWEAQTDMTAEVPNIIDFTVSPEYLNRPGLYPRQGTFLKMLFLQDELFTDYDHQVIGEWSEGYKLPEEALTPTFDPSGEIDTSLRYSGYWGCQPDIYERIRINKEAGRKWFREAVIVMGRRAGKNHIGAIAGAYILWHFIQLGDPQGVYGVDRDQRLAALVFANKKEHAKANQWRDLNQVILGAPCFNRWIAQPLGESLKVYAKYDERRIAAREAAGIDFDPTDMATFITEPREATLMAGRGVAGFMLFFDEMAHVVATSGSARSAEEVYGAATPSLEQFGYDCFIYEPSSPWQMMGQFYQNWLNSLEIDRHSRQPIYPEMFTIQLESWDIYEDWERAQEIPMYPGGRCYQPLKRAIISYDSSMRRAERANPEGFAVEHRARWAAAMDAYLNPQKVEEMFKPWGDRVIERTERGILAQRYVAHADPSKSGANFALAIAHTEGPDEHGFSHVVFDEIVHWEPGDFEGNVINYIEIEERLKDYVTRFNPSHFSFDQWNSTGFIQRLQSWIGTQGFPKRTMVFERFAEKKLNWKVAEVFKTAMNLNLIHAPYDELADLECRFLIDLGNDKVDKPDSGPVQTKDVFDAMSNVVFTLIGEQMMQMLGESLSSGPTPAMQGGETPFANTGIRPTDPGANEIKSAFAGFRRSGAPGPGTSPTRMGRFQGPGPRSTIGGSGYGRGGRRTPRRGSW